MADRRLEQGLRKAQFKDYGDPQTLRDQALSTRHLIDRLEFNRDHAEEHEAVMDQPGHDAAWNRTHAKGHEREMAETLDLLRKRKLLPGEESQDDGKLPGDDPAVVYMPPAKGPFLCGHCRYFVKDNAPCEKVSTPIETDGCCNLYEPTTRQ